MFPEKASCPILNINVKVGLIVYEAQSLGMNSVDYLEWSSFQNGASVGLRCATRLDYSWLKFNRPEGLNAEYAGLLFGLLIGRCVEIENIQIYQLLSASHVLSSTAALLGKAIQKIGTMDEDFLKILKIHIPSYVGHEIDAPVLLQGVALLSLGFVHFDRRQMTLGELLIDEITRHGIIPMQGNKDSYDDLYSMCAGISLGLIFYGSHSLEILSKLDAMRKLKHRSMMKTAQINCIKLYKAFYMASLMIFFQCNSELVSDRMDFPNSAAAYNQLRPDVVSLCVICKSMIMFDRIECTLDWVNQFMLQGCFSETRLHAFVACILAIGIKFMSSGTEKVVTFLLDLIDYKEKPYEAAFLALACSLVMNGTGDLRILKFLRVLHGATDRTNFGLQVVIHQALGFLFLGGCRFVLDPSRSIFVLLSVLPMLPASPCDNRSSLLCLKNLWVLSVRPRHS